MHIDGKGKLPLAVAQWTSETKRNLSVCVIPEEAAFEALTGAMPVFLPEHRVLALPHWDSIPYDRTRPSRRVTGMRVATLAALAEAMEEPSPAPTLILTTPEALCQRVPPAERLRERLVRLAVGDELDPEWLRATLEAFGYIFEERVDEAGEAAIRPHAVDIHPAGQRDPVRLELEAGRITEIRVFDPLSQRGLRDERSVRLLPASEAFLVPGETSTGDSPRAAAGLLPDGTLATLFDLIQGAALGVMEETEARIADWLNMLRESYDVALDAARTGQPRPPPPDDVFLTLSEVTDALAGHATTRFVIDPGQPEPALPPAPAARRAVAAMDQSNAAILATDGAPGTLQTILRRRLRRAEDAVPILSSWRDAETLAGGQIGVLELPLQDGFTLPNRTIVAVRTRQRTDADSLDRLSAALRIGDMVVDPERGVARLTGLAMEDQAGAPCECLVLEFLAGQRLLLPAFQIGRIWRYGAASTINPSRLDGAAWQERRTAAEQAIETAAVALVDRLRTRAEMKAPVIEPDAAYQRFLRRMPFAAGADQARAIRAVREDLARGRPMHRLVCGDVGFGKTEVALHAAALVAFAGLQVAVVAPTTILAQQHLATFRRRLRGFGLTIEPLIRSVRSKDGRAVLRAIEQGDVNIVIGTHATMSARFHNLGMVVIDEEQRFGEAQKAALRRAQAGAHTLVMTATPLPRTLQAALLGLIDVSLLSEPPAQRLPVRSILAPFDPATVRGSLLREARRGGQSFVICPRVEDIAPLQKQLQALVPELSLVVAHGRMGGQALDEAMIAFSGGDGDVLLATNIVEAGLDVPNANTMLVWRPDRFGLAQLHQLRGRVGRGRVRAAAYLLTDPDRPPGRAALKRLESFVALDSLGAGFAVSHADLDQRGAGNLLGEEQTGHMLLIGTERYKHVLERALARARGEAVPDDSIPEIVLDLPAYVPDDFVPEPNLRLEIYRLLSGLESMDSVSEAGEELADRFGALPPPVEALLDLTRLRLLCRTLGIAAIHAGPAAIALTPAGGHCKALAGLKGSHRSGDRVILPIKEAFPANRLRRLLATLAGSDG